MAKVIITQHLNRFVKYLVSCGTFIVQNPIFSVLIAGVVGVTIGTKYLVQTFIIPDASFYTDFTSIFFYTTDFLLIFGLFYTLSKKIWPNKLIFPLILWLIFQIMFVANPNILPIYYGTRLILILILYGLLSQNSLNKQRKYLIAALFSILGAVQTVIGFAQFTIGHSLGLYILGESPLNLSSTGIASFYLNGEKIVRAYGTFPHPNLLSAFLVASTLLNLYLLNKTLHKTTWYLWITTFFINIIGLLVTFSRSGILFGLISVQALIILMSWQNFTSNKVKIILIELLLLVSVILFIPYLGSRATISDSGTTERLLYNQIAINMLKENGLIGLGMGNPLFHMKHYTQVYLQSWDYQPIHNYYLLAITELGLGAMAIFYLLATLIKKTAARFWSAYKNREESFMWNITLLLIMSCFLLMNLFDHYFYTLPQGLLLFWIVASLCNMETVDE